MSWQVVTHLQLLPEDFYYILGAVSGHSEVMEEGVAKLLVHGLLGRQNLSKEQDLRQEQFIITGGGGGGGGGGSGGGSPHFSLPRFSLIFPSPKKKVAPGKKDNTPLTILIIQLRDGQRGADRRET